MKKKRLTITVSIALIVAFLFAYPAIFRKKNYMTIDTAALMDLISDEIGGYKLYLGLNEGDTATLDEKLTVEVFSDEISLSEGKDRELTFNVPRDGMYMLCAEQKNQNAKGGYRDIEFSVMLDGEYPFEESKYIYFPKSWETRKAAGEDFNGNQLRPILGEQREWYKAYAKNRTGYISEPIRFYLKAGSHTIILNPRDKDLLLKNLSFESYISPASYKEPDLTGQKPDVKPIQIQAENVLYRSSPSILEQIDRSSAATTPMCMGPDVYNTMGGDTWSERGDSLTWEFDVEKSGYYQIDMRVLQDYAGGIPSYRKLYIDGKVPFKETEIISIPYSFNWQQVTVMADGKPAWFFLDKGPHTITLECTLGEIEDLMQVVNNLLKDLNKAYRRIIMIITTNPDPYRDYLLIDKIPDVFTDLTRMSKVLDQIARYLYSQNKGSGAQTVLFERLSEQLKDFVKHPLKLQRQLNVFQSNISAVGTWINSRNSMPLEMDWIEFVPAGGSGSKINTNIISKIKYDIKRLLLSYTSDFNSFSTFGKYENNSVSVWVNTGRDQVQIINQLCNEFSAEQGIGVNLKLVEAGTVMMAVVAGTGPDVNIMGADIEPVNYAVRKAIFALNDMEGFDQAIKDFHPERLVPLTYLGKTFALPETERFPVLFYRKDIFEELGFKVPTTWEDVYDLLPDLQANNMQFGPYGEMYSMLLYQNSGAYYADDGKYSLLNSHNSIKAFSQWTRFFYDYGLPLEYDFLNRFRTGEVPIAIQDFGICNSLAVFAPEIKNEWAMTTVPGTVKEDGTIDFSVNSGGNCAYIFSNCKNKNNSWKFLKWWTSGPVQSSFATQIEIRLGEQARYNVASISAFENQLWSREQANVLTGQKKWIRGVPQVPGGYFVSRHLNNAFRKVVYHSADIRETLNEYTEVINKELTNKRTELGFGGDKIEN